MNCQHCQKEFIKSKFHPKQKYCSEKCLRKAISIKRIASGYNRDYYYKHKKIKVPRPPF